MKLPIIRCEKCNEILNHKNVKWLEFSQTDGNYYMPENFPKHHISQGSFSFGNKCAKNQLNETIENLKK